MKNWIKTVCLLFCASVMFTACIDDDVEEGVIELQRESVFLLFQ